MDWIQSIFRRFQSQDDQKNIILIGPPGCGKGTQLDALLAKRKQSLPAIVHFQADDAIIERRLSGRLIHQASGRSYHEEFSPPKVPMTDDLTGDRLIRRPDDNLAVVKDRLVTYRKSTLPLIDFYKSTRSLIAVDASKPVDQVFNDILMRLEAKKTT